MKNGSKNEKVNTLFILISVILSLVIIAIVTTFHMEEVHDIMIYAEGDQLVFYDFENKYNVDEQGYFLLKNTEQEECSFRFIERVPFAQTEEGMIYKNVISCESSKVNSGLYYFVEDHLLLEILVRR